MTQKRSSINLKKTISIQKNIDFNLEKSEMKKTPLRKSMLELLAISSRPLSQAEILNSLSSDNLSVDRVSVYRNLIQLKEKGVIHEVDSNSYVYCAHECDNHAHLLLFCKQCNKHQEIKDHSQIDGFMNNLKKFQFFSSHEPIYLRGICQTCSGLSK